MTTLDMINNIVESTGIGSRTKIKASIKALVLDFLNIQYEEIYRVYRWPNIKVFNHSVTTTDGICVLPNYLDAIQAARIGNNPIKPVSELFRWDFNPAGFDTAGSATNYMTLAPVPLLADAAADGVLVFKSDSATDATASALTVRIEGLVSGVRVSEENDLNGTADVTTTASFDAGSIISITKPRTTGRITVEAADASTELGTAAPDATHFEYKRIQLAAIVDTSTVVKFLCTRRFEPLVSDNDSLLIPIATNALLAFTKAEVFNWLGDDAAESKVRAKGSSSLEVALNYIKEVNDTDQSVAPQLGGFFFTDQARDLFDISVSGKDNNF